MVETGIGMHEEPTEAYREAKALFAHMDSLGYSYKEE